MKVRIFWFIIVLSSSLFHLGGGMGDGWGFFFGGERGMRIVNLIGLLPEIFKNVNFLLHVKLSDQDLHHRLYALS